MEPSSSEEDRNYAQLEAIFRAHVADLYRYIYRQVHQAVIAEDLTSSVFLKALRWLQQDRSPESVKGWLYATARSVIADYWREQTQINLLPLETAEEIPALSPESNDEQQQLLQTSIYRLLDGLPSRERDVLTLRYFQGYSAAEIGQALGISANYVRVLQLRALRHAASLETTERIVPMEPPAILCKGRFFRRPVFAPSVGAGASASCLPWRVDAVSWAACGSPPAAPVATQKPQTALASATAPAPPCVRPTTFPSSSSSLLSGSAAPSLAFVPHALGATPARSWRARLLVQTGPDSSPTTY
jgi:RNA polymerase sigma factor (sigma-70 family)